MLLVYGASSSIRVEYFSGCHPGRVLRIKRRTRGRESNASRTQVERKSNASRSESKQVERESKQVEASRTQVERKSCFVEGTPPAPS